MRPNDWYDITDESGRSYLVRLIGTTVREGRYLDVEHQGKRQDFLFYNLQSIEPASHPLLKVAEDLVPALWDTVDQALSSLDFMVKRGWTPPK